MVLSFGKLNKTMHLKLQKNFIFFLLVIILSFVLFYPIFGLALFGDDWLAFWRYNQLLDPGSSGHWNHLNYFLTPYGAQDIIMGMLYKIYGYNSTLYYLTSYLLRMVAAFSLYPLVFYLTKNKLSAFFAFLFFSITVTGLDATNWVFNMPSYITIAFFNLFLFFFLKARDNIKLLFPSTLLYYLAYITAPIRMHGSLPFILIIELFYLFQNRSLKTLKKVGLRFAVILIVFLIIRYTGNSQGPPQEASERFNLGINTMSEMLGVGRFDFLFYPIIMFGSMIVPDFILPSFQIISKSKLLWSTLLPSFLGFLAIIALLLKDIFLAKLKLLKIIAIAASCWIIIVILTFHFNLATFNDSRYILLTLIGGFSIILIISLLLKFFNQKNVSTTLFLGLSWSIMSFFFAWWWQPTSIFPTTYRYLIVSAIGISILLATIISLGKDKKKQQLLFVSLSLILILHIISTRIYINTLLDSHSQDISYKIWSSIPHIDEIGKSREPIIFYFEGDNTNSSILHDVITFGFPPHMALLYNLREEDGGFPVPMSNFKEVVSAVTDGKTMPAYGYPVKPVPIERIYAFHLQGKDNLINVTAEARDRLNKLLAQ